LGKRPPAILRRSVGARGRRTADRRVAIGGQAVGGFGRGDWVDRLNVRPAWRHRGLDPGDAREAFRSDDRMGERWV